MSRPRGHRSPPETRGRSLIRLSGKRDRVVVALGVAVVVGADGKLPTEVRIFKAGVNDTEKGPYLFDDIAAESVMAHQAAVGGVDRMIDLEHLSLDEDAPNFDPDARGWCRLEVRNGELWAVAMTWTPDGAERLTSRKQRYLSPAFPVDDDGRILKIVNIALTALPATHDAVALVAANTRGRSTMHPKLISLHVRLEMLKKLAADAPADGAAPGKAAAAKAALEKCSAACAEAEKAFAGSDIDATFAALEAALSAMDECETAVRAMTGGQPADTDTPTGDSGGGDAGMNTRHGDQTGADAAMRATGKTTAVEAEAEIKRLRAVALEHEKMVATLAAEKKVLEDQERRGLVAELVKLGHETPATAWDDDAGSVPAEPWASMNLVALRKRVEKLTGTKPITTGAGPSHPTTPITQSSTVNVDENELNRLRATFDRENRHVPEKLRRDFKAVEARYVGVREAQLAGEKDVNQLKRLARGLRAIDVLTDPRGQLVTLAQTPVQPIQQFGASSQRALEEFRLEYNSTLVSLPIPWSEDLGVMLPGGGLKDTYPLTFYAIKYREKKAQNAAATNPNSADVTVQKKLFAAAAQAELIRISKGDFAYIQAWGQNAAQMARARVNLRNHLITDLLEAGTSGYWGQTKDQATGIDGQPFFSASHKVNPFDPKMKAHGSATWANYAATDYHLTAGNLTTIKSLFLKVPGPDGEELGSRATGILVPTSLDEAARLLLTVQDLIIDAAASLKGVSNVMGGGNRNEHFNSGFERIWAPQLAGTDGTADYYAYSRETIGRGLPPWVLAEDASEEVRVWDENSDFYKNGSGFIKTESLVFCNAALLYPHGIRLVKGA